MSLGKEAKHEIQGERPQLFSSCVDRLLEFMKAGGCSGVVAGGHKVCASRRRCRVMCLRGKDAIFKAVVAIAILCALDKCKGVGIAGFVPLGGKNSRFKNM